MPLNFVDVLVPGTVSVTTGGIFEHHITTKCQQSFKTFNYLSLEVTFSRHGVFGQRLKLSSDLRSACHFPAILEIFINCIAIFGIRSFKM